MPAAVRHAARSLAVAFHAIAERVPRGARMIRVAAGGSGRLTAVHAAEGGPTLGVPQDAAP